MKQIILKSIVAIFAASLFVSCSNYSALYEKTDYYIDELTSHYESYGLSALGDKDVTSDGAFRVTPVGRMIVVKALTPLSDEERDKVCSALEKRYSDNARVNKVFINGGGTITIDCRR